MLPCFVFFIRQPTKNHVFFTHCYLRVFACITLAFVLFLYRIPASVSFPHRQRLTKRVCIHFSFSERDALMKISLQTPRIMP